MRVGGRGQVDRSVQTEPGGRRQLGELRAGPLATAGGQREHQQVGQDRQVVLRSAGRAAFHDDHPGRRPGVVVAEAGADGGEQAVRVVVAPVVEDVDQQVGVTPGRDGLEGVAGHDGHPVHVRRMCGHLGQLEEHPFELRMRREERGEQGPAATTDVADPTGGSPVQSAGEDQAVHAAARLHGRVEGGVAVRVRPEPVEEGCAGGGREGVAVGGHAVVDPAEGGQDLLTAHELDPGSPPARVIDPEELEHRRGAEPAVPVLTDPASDRGVPQQPVQSVAVDREGDRERVEVGRLGELVGHADPAERHQGCQVEGPEEALQDPDRGRRRRAAQPGESGTQPLGGAGHRRRWQRRHTHHLAQSYRPLPVQVRTQARCLRAAAPRVGGSVGGRSSPSHAPSLSNGCPAPTLGRRTVVVHAQRTTDIPRRSQSVPARGPTLHTCQMDAPGAVATDERQHAPERFPFTKFLPPVLDARVVTEHLVDRLDAAIGQHHLTVLAAPAGSGKTTALAAWAEATAGDVVWVRLDADDDEPSTLATALLQAGRRQLSSGFGGRLAPLLHYAGPAPGSRQLVAALVNDLGDHGQVTLVLDDVHALSDPTTLTFLEDLLDHLPPDVRVVLGSRVEPAISLPRRRVRGQVAELRLDDLRLDREAIRRVLTHEGTVADEQVDAVLAASNGWAAAVKLATAHVGADPGSDPAVRIGVADVLVDLRPFLTTEVLDALPERLRTFLLETSILDELSPAHCDAVTGRDDSHHILEDLERRNLFLARHRDGDEVTWRTHDLFAAFLRERLASSRNPAVLAELHRRASRCLPPLRALPHLLAAEEYVAAAELIVEVGLSNLDASMQLHLTRSIQALPREIRELDHHLALLLANVPLMTGDAHAVIGQLEPLRDRLLTSGNEVAAAEINGSLAAAYLQLGDLDAAGTVLEQALSHTGSVWHRPSTLAVGMWWCFYRNDWAGVSRMCEEALDLVLRSGDPNLSKVVGPALSPQLLFVDRGPNWIAETVDRLQAGLGGDDHATGTTLRTVRAGAALLRLEVAEAVSELQRCLAESTGYGQLAWTHQEAECLLMVLSLGSGDLATVQRIADGALPRLDDPVYRQYWHNYAYAAMRAHWVARDHRQVAEIHDRVLASQPRGALAEERVVRAIAESMLARIEGRTDDALALLLDGEQVQAEGRCWLWTGMPGLDRASLLLEHGRTAAAIEAALPTLDTAAKLGPGLLFAEVRANRAVLERCARGGIHRDLLQAVLTASEPPARTRAAVAIPGTDEVLSPRELEVLEQVAAGASNREIAGALFIGEATVKSHLTRILRKLEASSRTHAVARARERRLM